MCLATLHIMLHDKKGRYANIAQILTKRTGKGKCIYSLSLFLLLIHQFTSVKRNNFCCDILTFFQIYGISTHIFCIQKLKMCIKNRWMDRCRLRCIKRNPKGASIMPLPHVSSGFQCTLTWILGDWFLLLMSIIVRLIELWRHLSLGKNCIVDWLLGSTGDKN